MQKPTGFTIAIIVIILLVLFGVIFLSNGEDADNNSVTPTAVPTMNAASPEPSVTQDPTPQVTGDVSGDAGITLSEVSEHASADDCWMVIEGNVYDVTDFIAQHPGGDEILAGCGTDATALFNDRPDNRGEHSNTARALLPQYFVGELTE